VGNKHVLQKMRIITRFRKINKKGGKVQVANWLRQNTNKCIVLGKLCTYACI
jgi:hypothetical protein